MIYVLEIHSNPPSGIRSGSGRSSVTFALGRQSSKVGKFYKSMILKDQEFVVKFITFSIFLTYSK